MSTEQTPGSSDSPLPGTPGQPTGGPGTGRTGSGDPGAGHPGSGQHPGAGHPGKTGGDFFSWIRGLGVTRGPDRWAGGVASGLAHRWGIDPVIVRGLFIVAAIFLGIGVLAYGVLWLLLPEPDGRIHLQEAMRGRWTAGMTGGLVATILGLGGARAGFWFGEMRGTEPLWALFWIGIVGLVFFSIARSRRARRSGSPRFEASTEPTAAEGPQASPGQDPYGPASYGQGGYGPAPYGQGGYGQGNYGQGRYGAETYHSQAYDPAASGGQSYGAPYGGPYAGSPYGGSPYGGPYGGPARRHHGTSAQWARQQTALKPRRRGPGGPYTAVVLGLAVLVAGTLMALNVAGTTLVAPSTGALWAIGAGIIGLGIIVAGLLGRTSGLLSLFAIIALIAAAVTQPVSQFGRPRGTVNFAPTSVQQAVTGYHVTGSAGKLDLRQLDSSGPLTSDATIPVDATMSQLAIEIPKDIPVTVQADATMSSVQFGSRSISGFNTQDSQSYNTSAAGRTLVLKLDATMSNITIEQER
ncbi:PspC domain-containing protein [Sinomonas sp. ASV322]|uniref:PspC domain-containing protein n=1 Tax=Sinomonas sp. ASV322 TaxID=3041920 RepID=UPI0027DD1FE9|nr:PspC domain-containing protein [Sinomonas sp. ASV322]MDQ4501800.1 PspC domain-containing protein [Sinomonas sp. ASV322]